MNEKKSTGWQNVRHHLSNWSNSDLIALLKDLYDGSPDNRDFLQARFQAEANSGTALEKYRRKIRDQFFPTRGEGNLKLSEARKAIRDYRNATGNLIGTADLMLTYVESGTEFTLQFGDIDAPFYNSMESMLDEFAQLLLREGSELYLRFRDRIERLTAHADQLGWGYGDALQDQVHNLEDKLAGQ